MTALFYSEFPLLDFYFLVEKIKFLVEKIKFVVGKLKIALMYAFDKMALLLETYLRADF